MMSVLLFIASKDASASPPFLFVEDLEPPLIDIGDFVVGDFVVTNLSLVIFTLTALTLLLEASSLAFK